MDSQVTFPTVEQVAARYGASVDRVRENYRANAAQLTGMAEKAQRTGRKVNGYTAAQLRAMATQQTEIAAR